MDIRCPQCQTLYEFDESKLDSGSATLKCRKCEHMFRLGEDAQPSREDERRWMVREPDGGEILYFSGFDTLHQWIVEGEVDQTWELSRTGDSWERLGDIGEFRPIFQAVDNVSSVQGESTISRSSGGDSSGGRSKKDTLTQFEGAADSGGADERTERDRESSGVEVPDNSVSGGQVERPRDDRGGRQRTTSPAPGGTAADAERPSSGRGSGSREAAGDRGRQRSPSPQASQRGGQPQRAESEQSDVQIDSGRFGSESGGGQTGGAESDDWGMVDEAAGLEEDWEYESGGRSWPIVVGIGLLLAVGGAGYLWMFQRDMVQGWMASLSGASGGEEAATDDKTEGSGVDTASVQAAVNEARIGKYEALGAARGAAQTQGKEVVTAAFDRARSDLGDALKSGVEKAEASADEPAAGGGGGGGGGVISRLARANELLQDGNTARAKSLYREILDREPGNSEALTGLGWAELNSGNASGAERQFQKALDVNPSYGDAYIGLGHAHRQLGNPREALDAYETYLEKNPGGTKASIAEYQRDKLRKKLGIN